MILQFVIGCDEEPPLGFAINLPLASVLSETSSTVNEGIRALLNLFIYIFFYKKISHAQKAQRAQKAQNTN